jgi:salicylate 5-hydroxylase small subunit
VTIGLKLWMDLHQLYAEYAACLDEGRMADWPGFFTEDGHYRLVPRENHDRGLPLATMDLRGRGMLEDRVYGVTSTLFHAPYYQRHVIGPIRLLEPDGDTLCAEASYVVIRTKRDQMSEILNAGRYLDRVIETSHGLKFAAKICVFDSELIPNSIIYPI